MLYFMEHMMNVLNGDMKIVVNNIIKKLKLITSKTIKIIS
jgi:hypothetical protein